MFPKLVRDAILARAFRGSFDSFRMGQFCHAQGLSSISVVLKYRCQIQLCVVVFLLALRDPRFLQLLAVPIAAGPIASQNLGIGVCRVKGELHARGLQTDQPSLEWAFQSFNWIRLFFIFSNNFFYFFIK